jgi:hypothetical protein
VWRKEEFPVLNSKIHLKGSPLYDWIFPPTFNFPAKFHSLLMAPEAWRYDQ